MVAANERTFIAKLNRGSVSEIFSLTLNMDTEHRIEKKNNFEQSDVLRKNLSLLLIASSLQNLLLQFLLN